MTSFRRHFAHIAAVALALTAFATVPAAAQAASPAWALGLRSAPTNLAPSSSPFAPTDEFELEAANAGTAFTVGTTTATITLSPGLTVTAAISETASGLLASREPCDIGGETVVCTRSDSIAPGDSYTVVVEIDPGSLAEGSAVAAQATMTGGGAAEARTSTATTISEADAPFDFLPGDNGLSASLIGGDGLPSTQAGSHPTELDVQLGFPNRSANPPSGAGNGLGAITSSEGGPHDVRVALPKGVVINPQSSPKVCTEVELESASCPPESAIGEARLETAFTLNLVNEPSPLYNMVPPPGRAAAFAFNAAGIGIYPHIFGGVREGEYTLSASSSSVLSLYNDPFLGLRVEFWGDPSDPVYDTQRGECAFFTGPSFCGVESRQATPLVTAPTSCASRIELEAEADSWGNPGAFHSRRAAFTDSVGEPTPVTGCDDPELKFDPSLQARPTTNVADSPSGLEVDLHIPQREEFGTLATAHLRRAEVTLPEGLVVNPSGANGHTGCSSGQIGIDPSSGVANGSEPTCPDASKIGTVEVDTPLLDHPLPGSIYLAAPHDNPFDSLLAIYVVVDDPPTGVLIKLAGHVVPDPSTGRLTTVFDENPQLPFEDFKLHFFGGAAAPLRTPATCGAYSTTSQLTPWSAPQSGSPATPADTYAIIAAPAGASCPTSTAALPDNPSLDAGSVSLIAGHYTPFVLNLRRNDDSQQFASLSLTPPPGLLGKLVGTPYCPEADLAAAAAKSGVAEAANPSCPAASQVGTVQIAAGAGPAPYYAHGKAYLAGPYKGAPLSIAIVTPATAGPFDLGTVVVRSALQIDPETTRITAVSDPIPQILQGIPLDVRSISLQLDKPEFTLNPTSCDPMSLTAQLTSDQGQALSLQNPFQVAECARLAFKPSLSLRLKGGTRRSDHPALRAVLAFPAGNSANIAKASVALPHSEFLDQAHIRTICTRVQFAAEQCPKGSIYGRARAFTPLLEKPLEGPVYLRSSSHPLPDLVADLRGQIHVVLDGRIDSVKGGIRTTFEGVPDAPVSKFVLEMQGAKKGLLVNSRNICQQINRATVLLDAQNSKTADSHPALKADCRTKRKAHKPGDKHKR